MEATHNLWNNPVPAAPLPTSVPTFRERISDTVALGAISFLFLTSNLIIQNWLLFPATTPIVKSESASSQSATSEIMISEIATAPAVAAPSLIQPKPTAPAEIFERSFRIDHAKELLGQYFSLSPVARTSETADVSQYVRTQVVKNLPGAWKRKAPKISEAILESARKYKLDPLFLVAMIQTESDFEPNTRGPFGEIGLMQLREETGKEIAPRVGMTWNGRATLRDPVKNIRLGAGYLAFLRERFNEKALLYIAAYNMGANNVRSALARQVWPRDYSARIMKKYFGLYAKLPRALASVVISKSTRTQ